MNLDETKHAIKFISADVKNNETCLALLLRPGDCFGCRYDVKDQNCFECVLMAEVDGRKEPLWVFCKEIFDQSSGIPSKEEPSQELKEAIQEVESRKEEPKVVDSKVRLSLAGVLSQKRNDHVGTKPELETKEKSNKEVVSMAEEKKEAKESKTDVVRSLLTEGKTNDEVAKVLADAYVAEGRQEAWAVKRGKGIVKLFIKKYGDPRIKKAE